jgi:hypothetical protein
MKTTDIERLVSDKMDRLAGRPTSEIWAANAALCARVFVLAAPGWQRWPELKLKALQGFHAMLSHCVDPDTAPASERLLVGLESFDIEDDGSQEWQNVVDLITMLLNVLNDEAPEASLRNAMTTYLDGTFHAIANAAAASLDKPISRAEALRVVERDPTWRAAKEFVLAL